MVTIAESGGSGGFVAAAATVDGGGVPFACPATDGNGDSGGGRVLGWKSK